MEHLKTFTESIETTLEDKVQSIIDMYLFLCNRNDIEDGGNFIGQCSSLMIECGIRDRIKSGDRRLYNPDKDKILQRLDNSRFGLERLEAVNKLYLFAKEVYGNRTIDDVEKMIMPVINDSNVVDGHIYRKDWFWRDFDNKQAYIFEFKVDPEIYEIDEKDVMGKGHPGDSHWLDKEKIPKMKTALNTFWRYRRIFKKELRAIPFRSNGFRYEMHDSSHFNDIYSVRILILPIESESR